VTADDVMPSKREDTNPADTDLYNATRWALGSMMQSWALWMKDRDVRVNALCVGPTDTPTGREMFPGRTGPWLQPDDVASVLLDLLREGPGGRTGENIGVWPGEPLELGPRKLPHKAMTG
jgi:NAD(P)-dependent dehydrogenase (short-subunit alcohol dehydrogenase family)